MKVVLIFRSKKLRYHSIENVFGTIQNQLGFDEDVEAVYVEKRGFSLLNLLNLRKTIRKYGRDTIYHVTGDIHYAVFALPRKRTILTIHDCVFINKLKGLKGWILKKLYLDWPVRYVPTVTAISQKTRNEVLSLTGCRPGKIKVINNPVSSYVTSTPKQFNAANPVLLFIGSLPNKNLNRVIEALKGFPCKLHIIGHADEQQRVNMKKYNIQYVLETNVTNEQMADRYAQCDVVVFPSLYEGFGLPVIEGFKAGRAVLTSEISPLKELSDGAAWLVDPYSSDSIRNALERIVNDPDARCRKVNSGFKIVQQYSPETIASQYQQAYLNLRRQKPAMLASVVQ